MPLPVIDLDDRTFDDLFEEALSLVPAHAPGWTNHNLSDPGVTLVELFAWLAEMLIFRANQVPESHRVAFLRLLNGPEWTPPADIEAEIERTLGELRSRWRAVACEDYEELSREVSANVARVRCVPRRNLRTGRDVDAPGSVTVLIVPGDRPSVLIFDADRRYLDLSAAARTELGPSFGLPGDRGQYLFVGAAEPFRGVFFALEQGGTGYQLVFAYGDGSDWIPLGASDDLDDGTSNWRHDGLVSFDPPPVWRPMSVEGAVRYWLRVETTTASTRVAQALQVVPDDRLLERISDRLEERRILGVTHYVQEPSYVPVAVEAILVRVPGADEAAVRAAAATAIEAFLDPLEGGPDGGGWPFGRPIYVSELQELLRGVAGVDHVADLRLAPGTSSSWLRAVERWNDSGEQSALEIGPHRLPEADIDPVAIRIEERSLVVRLRVDVELAAAAARREAARGVREAVRAFFHPGLASGPGYEPLEAAVLSPGMLRNPVEAGLRGLGAVRRIELESDPARMHRDEVLDAVVVTVEDGELVEPLTIVRFEE
jgi:hypothetical protein